MAVAAFPGCTGVPYGTLQTTFRLLKRWCRRRDLNPRPPAYEMKNRNVWRISCSALQDIRMHVRTGFSIDQIFSYERTPEYCSEIQRTTVKAEDCNHEVTRIIVATINVRYRKNAITL
jgi:hypothetical protein